MKYFFIIPSIFIIYLSTAQTTELPANFYVKQWHDIDSLYILNDSIQAFELLNNLHKKAEQEDNTAQFIKTLLFKTVQSKSTNSGYADALRELQQVSNTIKYPIKPILQIMLSEIYVEFLRQNYRHVPLKDTILPRNDIRSMTSKEILALSKKLLVAAYSDIRTQQLNINILDALTKPNITEEDISRPTIFDFIAYRGLSILDNIPYELRENYNIPHQTILMVGELDSLIHSNIPMKDSLNPAFLKYEIIKKLLAFHKNDTDQTALVEAEMFRLKYNLEQNYGNENFKKTYQNALENMYNTYKNTPSVLPLAVKISEYYEELGHAFHPKYYGSIDTTKRYYYKKAFEICQRHINQKQKSGYNTTLEERINRINRIDFELKMEEVNLPNKPILAQLAYKNIDTIYGRWLYRPTYTDTFNFKNDSLKWAFYNQLKIQQSFSKVLPHFDDFQKHTVEIILDSLPLGNYVLLLSSDPHFKETFTFNPSNTEGVTTQYIATTVSNIGVFYSSEYQHFIAVNRLTGVPIPNVQMSIHDTISYSNQSGIIKKRPADSAIFTYQNDTLIWQNSDFRYRNHNSEDELTEIQVKFFTDRNIYRPSQKIEFKGILIKKDRYDDSKNKIWAKQRVKIGLFKEDDSLSDLEDFDDAIESKILTTNEFGSFADTFTAPNNGELGEYKIIAFPYSDDEKEIEKWEDLFEYDDMDASTIIRIEEYKRPRFEANFEPISQAFKPHQYITVKGYARSLANSNVDGAKVEYSITRNETWSLYNYNGYTPAVGIVDSVIYTDSNGLFAINFKAEIPDLDSQILRLKKFDFTINATITDLNGETHEAKTTVKVGASMLEINLISSPKIDRQTTLSLPLSINKINGTFVPTKGSLKIEKLEDKAYFKTRYWSSSTDTFMYDLAYFNKILPEYAFSNTLAKEDDKPHILKTIYFKAESFDSTILKNGLILPKIKMWEVGKYQLTINVFDTELGDSLSKSIIFEVFDFAQRLAPNAQDLSIFFDKKTFDINQKTPIYIHSPFDKATALIEIIDNDSIIKSEWLNISKFTTYYFTPSAKIKGNLGYRVTIVKNNRSFCKTGKIPLAKDNKNLKLDFTSFRDRLAPGQNENWTIKITDTNGKPVSAELVATLYDAALDNLKDNNPYNWYILENTSRHYSSPQSVIFNDFDDTDSKAFHNIQQNFNQINIDNIQPQPRIWLWFSPFYDTDENDFSLLNFLSNKKGENPNEILRGIFYKDGKRYVSIITQIQADSNGIMKPFVVVGYNTVAKKSMTGSVSTIRTADFSSITQSDLANMLQGRAAGISVIQGAPGNGGVIKVRGTSSLNGEQSFRVDGTIDQLNENESSLQEVVVTGYGTAKKNAPTIKSPNLAQMKIRKNLSETVFFMPQLHTDSKGSVQLSFTMNEALTRWKFMSFAHTKSLQSGILYNAVVTQKDLMVFPNMPRFLREGDEIELTAKISNFKTGEILKGISSLSLFNAETEKPIDSLFLKSKPIIEWATTPNASTLLKWEIKVPVGLEIPALTWRMVAQADNFSDGEQNTIPILPKQILLTQTIPLSVEGGKTENIHFEQMDNADTSSTLKHHRWALNIITNPAWNAITGLAYSMEYPHECSEQLFSRFYSNTLAASIFEKMPQIKQYLTLNNDKKAALNLISPDLQRTLMEEAPELIQSNGIFDKRKLAHLFDLNKMAIEKQKAFDKFTARITPSGGLSWYPDGEPSWFISQHIAAGLGHLKTLGVELPNDTKTNNWIKNLVTYTDNQLVSYYKKVSETTSKSYFNDKFYTKNLIVHHAYTRSFYPQIPQNDTLKRYLDSTLTFISNNWKSMDLYQKALGALALHRFGKRDDAQNIIHFLKSAAQIDATGMHWGKRVGIYWYEMPVETQAILIEAFNEINHDSLSISLMKKHLLNQMKCNGRWESTKATTEAIYALLLVGNTTVNKTSNIKITTQNSLLAKQVKRSIQEDNGFIHAVIKMDEIDKKLSKTSILNQNIGLITGNISWQFYENIDKTKAFNNVDTTVQLSKKIYKISLENGEEILLPIDSTPLSIGDKLRVKLSVKTHKSLEYVHLKDMRPAASEPLDVVSKRDWNGISYYKTTRDVSTNFFFDYIPIGSFELEYDVTLQQRGNFASGVSSLQCMYVPSITVYTEGVRLKIQ